MSDASGRERSVVLRVLRDLAGTAERWVDGSRVVAALGEVADRFGVAAENAAVGEVVATLGKWTRASWWYRWLTADPDPDVIVIDLRETYTVGPVLRVLDRIVRPLATAWHTSGAADTARTVEEAPLRALGVVLAVATLANLALAAALGDLTSGRLGAGLVTLALAALAVRERRSAEELAATRAGRALRAVFEPPPIEGEDGTAGGDHDGTSGTRGGDGQREPDG